MRKNQLNDLTAKEWLKFQKSWFIHNPPPRSKGVLMHPAKFPETLVQQFIEFVTKRGMTVLDQMAGTGSTLIACLRSERNGYGIELNEKYAEIARQEIEKDRAKIGAPATDPAAEIFTRDARHLVQMNLPLIDYSISSPPYCDVLRMKGAETQKKER